MIIFGGTGDLSQKKLLPAMFHLHCDRKLEKFSLVGVGRRQLTDESYRDMIKRSLVAMNGTKLSAKAWADFSKNIFYHQGDVTDAGSFDRLCGVIAKLSHRNKTDNVIYYLAVQPSLTPKIIEKLASKKLCLDKPNAKVVIEKPFGHNQQTAIQLDQNILSAFQEKQIYRIDHYLGKETVQNILYFRFGNSIFEPLWNRNYIDNVQITVAEDIGVEDRGQFYEEAGVIRDIVQNHIMQLIAMIAMEAPVSFKADRLQDEKVKVFRAMRTMHQEYIAENMVVGQYDEGRMNGKKIKAYRQEKEIASNSKTPTYFAGKFYIDNWRWANVPFYVRVGKRLAKRTTYIAITFKKPPLKLLGRACDLMHDNTLVFGIQPHEYISLKLNVKNPDEGSHLQPVKMMFDYNEAFQVKTREAYERLLLDCVKGDQSLFARQDGIETMWAIVDPIIKAVESGQLKLSLYPAGSWGPKTSDELLAKNYDEWIGV